jgi:Cof subfamily protein (haloacid dehalogenase superfamily)
MHYKIVFTDLDGTLLSQKKDISSFTVDCLRKLQQKIPVILVSARMPKSMKYIQAEINGKEHPLICYNGALLVQENKIISSETISPELAHQLYENALLYEVNIGLYYHDNWYADSVTDRIEKEIFNTKAKPIFTSLKQVIESHKTAGTGFHKIMCMGTKNKLDSFYNSLRTNFSKSVKIYHSNDTVIEISPENTSKLSGIKVLLKEVFKLPLGQAMAFGDNYNDIDMIAQVGHGVAVANARNEVKQVSNAVTDDYKNDGVAKYLAKVFKL